jgi:hypothetical protein
MKVVRHDDVTPDEYGQEGADAPHVFDDVIAEL